MGDLPGKRRTKVENLGIKSIQARALQGSVTFYQEGCHGEKNFKVKGPQD